MIELLARINNSINALTRVHRLLPWLIAYLLLLPLPKLLEFSLSDYYIDLANRACLFILLCVGLNIVKGFCGQVTVGHIGLYAIGAVSSALLALNYGLSFWISAPLAMLITGFAGIIVGLPSVRLEGAYLALATLGLGESVRIMIAVTPALGSSTGIMLIPAPVIGDFVFDSFERYYYLVMTVAVLGIYLSFAILRSATGRAFQAIREDPIAASAVGINVTMYKLLAFVISALYAGLGGALFSHMPPGYIHHNNFTIIEMVTLLLMVVLGGIGNIWGGVIGAIVVTVIYDQTKDYYFYQPLIFGITMVLLVVFMPRGIGGLIERMIVKKKFIKKHEDKVIGIA
ncbi:MAG: branched-chain amino acid ABC transporter permease [SAR324 cluster bacterium]|nr:branched-chain amino acid ABC transporter permease [SAR324 cluster bacterium]